VNINGGDVSLPQDITYIPGYTIQPDEYISQAEWHSSNPEVASVDSNGIITTNNIGTTVITLTVGTLSDSVSITVYKRENGLPLKEGPYEPRIDSENGNNNFSLVVSVSDKPNNPEPTFRLIESGSIKLEDILDISDFSGISVKAEDAVLSSRFRINTDKSGDPAIIYEYYPTDISLWYAERNGPTGIYVNLILSKDGYTDTKIIAHLLYNDSIFEGGRGDDVGQ
jgi:hypothetical protein